MRAVEISRFGGPEVLQIVERPEPTPGPGDVLLAVRAAEVLFLDTQLRAGWGQDFFPMRPPWVPGTGVAGEVTAIGADVDPARIGELVIARTGNEGGYVERLAVAAADAFAIPDGVDPVTATAALHDGVLALDRLEEAAVREGSRVLVTAAAGSLGHWFVPLAKAAGARVTAAVGSSPKRTAAAALGPDATADYSGAGWAEPLGPFDVVFDGVGGDVGRAALAQTVDGGLFFGHGAASGDFAAQSAQRHITVIGNERRLDDATWRRLTLRALDLLARGEVCPVIGQRVPLERADDAHAAMAARSVIGKTVLVA